MEKLNISLQNLGNENLRKLFEMVRQNNALIIDNNAERLRAKYGDFLTDNDILRIVQIEEQMAYCAKCKGLPCTKRVGKETIDTFKAIEETEEVAYYTSNCSYVRRRDNFNRMVRLFRGAGISEAYAKMKFKDYKVDADNKVAVMAAQRLLNGEITGLYLYGAFGCGKTMLASILANEFHSRNQHVIFYKSPMLIKDLQAAMFDKEADYDKERVLLDKLNRVDVLIIDDLGMSEKITTYSAGRLAMIIDARYENKKLKTIITSNYKLGLLQERLDNPVDSKVATYDGSRIVDRLSEMCTPVLIKGGSRRSN